MNGDIVFYKIVLMLLVEAKLTVKNGRKGRKTDRRAKRERKGAGDKG